MVRKAEEMAAAARDKAVTMEVMVVKMEAQAPSEDRMAASVAGTKVVVAKRAKVMVVEEMAAAEAEA